jgi:membrane protease subunit HflK
MERNGQSGAVTNFLLLLLAGVLAFSIGRYSHSLSAQVASYTIAFAVVITLVSWVQMRLEEQERLEQLEFEEVTRGGASSSLFNTGESETFPARRTREIYERIFVPIFSGVVAVGQGVVAYLAWRWLTNSGAVPLRQPLLALGLFGGLFIVLFLIGQYSTGVARLESRRLLRPSGNFLLLASYLMAIASAVVGAAVADFPRADFYAAKALCILLGLLSLEGVISVVFDIYRPRIKGKVAHPLYDSRLVGLLSHPEGVFSTAASALDYQFGFKVSETWFYQFLRTNFPWLVLAQLGLLLVSTCAVIINPGEQALLERLGRPVTGREVLGPGLHFKWPYPVDDVRRFRTDEIQSFLVGAIPNPDTEHDPAFLWTVSHYKEEFNLPTPSAALAASGTSRSVSTTNTPLSLLTVSVPIHYQISDLRAYAYNYDDAGEVLQRLANRELTLYFSKTDVHDLLTRGQSTAAEQLQRELQKRVDELKLGVKLLFVGLQDIHPPVSVAKDYEAVIDASQWRGTNRLDALGFQAMTNSLATAESNRIVVAEISRSSSEVNYALARAARFTNQLAADAIAPVVYRRRSFLQAYTNALGAPKKIVITTTNTDGVIQWNLEETIGEEFLKRLAPAAKP